MARPRQQRFAVRRRRRAADERAVALGRHAELRQQRRQHARRPIRRCSNGWGARGYNWEYTVSAQHELAPRVSISGGWYRREFGNQTLTVDQRYDKSSYDGPFCVNAPSRSEPAGRRRLSGVRPLRPEAGAGAACRRAACSRSRTTTAARRTSIRATTCVADRAVHAGRLRPGRHQRDPGASSISATWSTPASRRSCSTERPRTSARRRPTRVREVTEIYPGRHRAPATRSIRTGPT